MTDHPHKPGQPTPRRGARARCEVCGVEIVYRPGNRLRPGEWLPVRPPKDGTA